MKTLGLILVGVALTVGASRMLSTSPEDGYAPSASEVAIREDYDHHAENVVHPDNYKAQLAKIERELLESR